MIYRLAEAADWRPPLHPGFSPSAAPPAGAFTPAAERPRGGGGADRHYAGRAGLVLLAVDEARLHATLRRENTSGGTELFPHVYGPIPLAAVVAHAPLERDAAGTVRWPAGW